MRVQCIVEFLNSIDCSIIDNIDAFDLNLGDALCTLPNYDEAHNYMTETCKPGSLVIFSEDSAFEAPADSTTLRHIGDYYHAMADIIEDVEEAAGQAPLNSYEKIFSKDLIIDKFGQDKYKDFINKFKKEQCIKDELGGVHDEGLGWSPKGTFCGECCNTSCVECPSSEK